MKVKLVFLSLLVFFLSKQLKKKIFSNDVWKIILEFRKITPEKLFWQTIWKQAMSFIFFPSISCMRRISKNVAVSSIASAACVRAGNKSHFSSACPVLYWENYSFSLCNLFVAVHVLVSKIKYMRFIEKTCLKIVFV